jgi:hypothetical protein
MRHTRHALLLFIIALATMLSVFAQDAQPNTDPLALADPPPMGEIRAADDSATVVTDLVAKFPVLSSVLLVVGFLRLTVKPIIATLHARAASTPGTEDDERLAKIQRSWWLRALLFVLDWGASIKPLPR